MGTSEDDLITPEQGSEVMGGRMKAQAIRLMIRKGRIPLHRKTETPSKVFVKRSELLAAYSRVYRLVKPEKRSS
jgi:hypothetical protein